MRKYAFIFVLLFLFSGCSQFLAQNPSPAAGQQNNNEAIVFNTDIGNGIFHENATITVRIYNPEQIETVDKTADCPVSMDGQLLCPDGVSYAEVKPQTYIFRKNDIVNGQITFRTNHIKTGQNYRIHISGLSEDNCNNAAAIINGTASGTVVNITNPQWAVTEMACLP